MSIYAKPAPAPAPQVLRRYEENGIPVTVFASMDAGQSGWPIDIKDQVHAAIGHQGSGAFRAIRPRHFA